MFKTVFIFLVGYIALGDTHSGARVRAPEILGRMLIDIIFWGPCRDFLVVSTKSNVAAMHNDVCPLLSCRYIFFNISVPQNHYLHSQNKSLSSLPSCGSIERL